MNRNPQDYMSRGVNPANVPVARLRREVERDGTVPGGGIALNPQNYRPIEQELQEAQGRVTEGLYGDWRGVGLPGTGVSYARIKPTPGIARAMTPQPMAQTEYLGDVVGRAGQVAASGGPLEAMPNEWVQSPGIAREVARYPGTGQPAGTGLPAAPPAGMEDLRSLQPMFAPVPDMQLPQSQVIGSPSDARLPRAGRGASPTAGGRPAVMPQPRR